MEQRYIMLIKEFRQAHIAGSKNTVADALSRPHQITAMRVRLHQDDPDYAYLVLNLNIAEVS